MTSQIHRIPELSLRCPENFPVLQLGDPKSAFPALSDPPEPAAARLGVHRSPSTLTNTNSDRGSGLPLSRLADRAALRREKVLTGWWSAERPPAPSPGSDAYISPWSGNTGSGSDSTGRTAEPRRAAAERRAEQPAAPFLTEQSRATSCPLTHTLRDTHTQRGGQAAHTRTHTRRLEARSPAVLL